MRSSLIAFAVTACLSSLASAGTFVVDAAGSGNFTDLPPAIAAASPGDVLLVLPGVYSGFTLDKRLVILGQGPAVKVNGPVNVQNIAVGATTALARLEFYAPVTVSNCTRTLVLDEITVRDGLDCFDSSDVRVSSSDCRGRTSSSIGASGHTAIVVAQSRLEVTESNIVGSSGNDGGAGIFNGGDGGHGIAGINGGVRLHLYRSSCSGGNGGWPEGGSPPLGQGGDGGDGVSLAYPLGDSEATIAGSPVHLLIGGTGGDDGVDGFDLRSNGDVRLSGVTATSIFAPLLQQPTPNDPALFTPGVPIAGQLLTFRVVAEPGSSVDLLLGRNATVSDVPGLAEDLLIVQQRKFPLGVVGATGLVSFNLPVLSTWPKGFTFFAQAKVTLPSSEIRYTNSTPLVVR
ncbi:MAG: hypothetical protein K8S98_18975 [Planctomycetes bacterium]|nr:hypothetical protein [Planctomycetota bacterium]